MAYTINTHFLIKLNKDNAININNHLCTPDGIISKKKIEIIDILYCKYSELKSYLSLSLRDLRTLKYVLEIRNF